MTQSCYAEIVPNGQDDGVGPRRRAGTPERRPGQPVVPGTVRWAPRTAAAGVAPIFLAAPTSTEARLAALAAAGRGFVYAQASLGVTGLRASLAAGIDELVSRVRAHTDRPVCVGIGVSDAEQAATVARFADGVIVGTALVRRLGQDGVAGVAALTAELADAVRGARRPVPGATA